MIVSCPSCGARYRVEATSDGERARCSGCGGVVPIVAAPRPYVLLPAAAGGAPWLGARERNAGDVASRERAHGASDALPQTEAGPRKPSGPAPYDPWTDLGASTEPSGDDVPRREGQATGHAGSPLLPALLALVGALLGYWCGTRGLFSGIPAVRLAGSAGLAVLGASAGLVVGWAADRWTAGR